MHTERAQLKLEAAAVYTALGLNERLFICTSSQVEQLVRKRCLQFKAERQQHLVSAHCLCPSLRRP